MNKLLVDVDLWHEAVNRACQLRVMLGVRDQRVTTTIQPLSDGGYRVSAIRQGDGATRTVFVRQCHAECA